MANKRKSSKKPVSAVIKRAMSKRKPTLAELKEFPGLFCNEKDTVRIKVDKRPRNGREPRGGLECSNCGQSFKCATHYLATPVDIYSCCADACDDVIRPAESDRIKEAMTNAASAPDNASDFAIVSGRKYIEARRRNATTVTRPLANNSGRASGSGLRNDLARIRNNAAPDTSPAAVAARMEAERLAKERRAPVEEEARQRMVEERETDEYESQLADEQYRPLASSVYIPLVAALRDALGDTRGVSGNVEQSPTSSESGADDGTRSQARSVRRSQQNPNHDREVWARHIGARPLDTSDYTLVGSSAPILVNRSASTVNKFGGRVFGNSDMSSETSVNSASDSSIMRADYIPTREADTVKSIDRSSYGLLGEADTSTLSNDSEMGLLANAAKIDGADESYEADKADEDDEEVSLMIGVREVVRQIRALFVFVFGTLHWLALELERCGFKLASALLRPTLDNNFLELEALLLRLMVFLQSFFTEAREIFHQLNDGDEWGGLRVLWDVLTAGGGLVVLVFFVWLATTYINADIPAS